MQPMSSKPTYDTSVKGLVTASLQYLVNAKNVPPKEQLEAIHNWYTSARMNAIALANKKILANLSAKEQFIILNMAISERNSMSVESRDKAAIDAYLHAYKLVAEQVRQEQCAKQADIRKLTQNQQQQAAPQRPQQMLQQQQQQVMQQKWAPQQAPAQAHLQLNPQQQKIFADNVNFLKAYQQAQQQTQQQAQQLFQVQAQQQAQQQAQYREMLAKQEQDRLRQEQQKLQQSLKVDKKAAAAYQLAYAQRVKHQVQQEQQRQAAQQAQQHLFQQLQPKQAPASAFVPAVVTGRPVQPAPNYQVPQEAAAAAVMSAAAAAAPMVIQSRPVAGMGPSAQNTTITGIVAGTGGVNKGPAPPLATAAAPAFEYQPPTSSLNKPVSGVANAAAGFRSGTAPNATYFNNNGISAAVAGRSLPPATASVAMPSLAPPGTTSNAQMVGNMNMGPPPGNGALHRAESEQHNSAEAEWAKKSEESKKRKDREDSPQTDETNYFDEAWMAVHKNTMEQLKAFQKAHQKLNDAVQLSFRKLGVAEEHQEALDLLTEFSLKMEEVADALLTNLTKKNKKS